jgi:type II secretory pathway pseudopilin PulG
MTPHRPNNPSMRGVVLLALLLGLALMGIALLAAVETWSTARQREAEADLLYIGDQYRKAIERFYYVTPASVKTYPTRLEDLLEDKRFPVPVRHLRRPYRDPMTSEAFEILYVGDQIVGVASTSKKKPIKRSGFAGPYGFFAEQESYSQWKFVFNPPLRGGVAPPIRPASSQGSQFNGAKS